jgi:hypothetical protein
MAKKLIFSCLLLIAIVGCGYYEGVVQPTPQSYVIFTGNIGTAVAVIDGAITVNIDEERRQTGESSKSILFQIAPGKHKIIVTKAGKEVVNRVVLIADGATKEILIP